MKLSSEQKRVLELSKKLLPLDEEVRNNWANVIDGEYTAHHCDMLNFSQSIEEYQVIRSVDVEIEPMLYPEYRLTQKQTKEFAKHNEDYDWLIEEYFDGDPNEAYYEHEEKEIMQRWINMNSGKITVLGKVYSKNPNLFSFCRRSRWRVVNAKHSGFTTKTFWKRHQKSFGTGFYQDITVHPKLQQYGYKGLDAMDWAVDCGSVIEERQTAISKYFDRHAHNEGWENYLLKTSRGQNPDEAILKLMSNDDFFRYDELDENMKQQYLTAYKIASRHNYEQRHNDLWHDMVLNLIQLGKDIHNPHYVCPTDLREAHQRYYNQYAAMKAKEEILKDLEKAIAENEQYIKVCQRFLDIVLRKDDIIIRPLRSVEEFVKEGNIMHNCVYRMGYYKKSNTLILSAQDTKEQHIATIELNTHNWKIIQLRGVCNQDCKRHDEISQIIYDNINLFKRAAKRKAA